MRLDEHAPWEIREAARLISGDGDAEAWAAGDPIKLLAVKIALEILRTTNDERSEVQRSKIGAP